MAHKKGLHAADEEGSVLLLLHYIKALSHLSDGSQKRVACSRREISASFVYIATFDLSSAASGLTSFILFMPASRCVGSIKIIFDGDGGYDV